jgi:Matrixin
MRMFRTYVGRMVAFITLLGTSFTLFLPSSASAYNTFNNHVLNGGVGNYGNNKRYYYITSSASSYESLIDQAMNEWIYTTERVGITTPISYRKTTTMSQSVMDIYAGSYYPSYMGVLGETEFWKYDTKLDPYQENWGWNKIKLNNPNFNNLNSTDRKGTIAHEMGHAFGLAHNNSNPYAIMCQLGYGRKVSNSQADDLHGINYLY